MIFINIRLEIKGSLNEYFLFRAFFCNKAIMIDLRTKKPFIVIRASIQSDNVPLLILQYTKKNHDRLLVNLLRMQYVYIYAIEHNVHNLTVLNALKRPVT